MGQRVEIAPWPKPFRAVVRPLAVRSSFPCVASGLCQNRRSGTEKQHRTVISYSLYNEIMQKYRAKSTKNFFLANCAKSGKNPVQSVQLVRGLTNFG